MPLGSPKTNPPQYSSLILQDHISNTDPIGKLAARRGSGGPRLANQSLLHKWNREPHVFRTLHRHIAAGNVVKLVNQSPILDEQWEITGYPNQRFAFSRPLEHSANDLQSLQLTGVSRFHIFVDQGRDRFH